MRRLDGYVRAAGAKQGRGERQQRKRRAGLMQAPLAVGAWAPITVRADD
ncbi:MAG TPA: hypothetical protein VFY39_12680 [Gammaproteobacteria bacterium]|nr:hypothetical protein [Gammaproteobacteria bacterium]